MNTKKVNIIICDDIRHEQGGKLSFMGVYGRDIVFSKIPAVMNQLGIVIIIRDLEKPLTNLHVTIELLGEDILSQNINVPKNPSPKQNKYEARLVMQINGVPIKKAGEAKIILRKEEGEKPFEVYTFDISQAKSDTKQ